MMSADFTKTSPIKQTWCSRVATAPGQEILMDSRVGLENPTITGCMEE